MTYHPLCHIRDPEVFTRAERTERSTSVSTRGDIWSQKTISNLISYYCVVLLGELFQLLILTLSQICSLFVPHIRVKIKD